MKVKELIKELERFRPNEDVLVAIQEPDGFKEEREIVTLRQSLNGVEVESEARRWSN